ncbi:MAG: ankyrin repeat domain-containing protein [Butyrivibrio sp.]|nr:ankyrin repeat domain-containing protein [Butyrivibrio sp.]
MKKLFKSIRDRKIETVKQIIEKQPELVNCIAKQPPQKDDGQSPLQVAFKTGNTDIAEYLIDMGANVNFIEDESCCNSWRTPVLHDAINCAVMCCRWNTNDEMRGFKVYSTKEKADEALRLLKKMIDAGADVNAVDSHGNSGLNRFGLQANQILPPYNYVEHIEGNSRIFTDDVHMDLRNVLQVLKDAGADVNYKAPNIGYSVRDFYREGSISVLFGEVFGTD